MLNTLEMDKEDVLKLITYLKKVKEIDFRIGYVQFTIISLFSYILPAAFLALIAYVGVFNSKTIFFMIFLFFYMLFGSVKLIVSGIGNISFQEGKETVNIRRKP